MEKQNAALRLRLREEQELVNQQLTVTKSLAAALEAQDARHPELRSAAVRASLVRGFREESCRRLQALARNASHVAQVMQHRHDYVDFASCPPSKTATRTSGAAAADADDDASAGGASVIPLLLGRSGQEVAVAGETGHVPAHEVAGAGALRDFVILVSLFCGERKRAVARATCRS
jgi:hypothetical protein